MSPILRSQIISRSLAPNRHYQHKPFPQTFSVFNPWEGLGNSNVICFSPKSQRGITENWGLECHGAGKACSRGQSKGIFMRDLFEAPWSHTTGTQSLLLPCPGAAGAGRQDLGNSPRNTVTDPWLRAWTTLPFLWMFPWKEWLSLKQNWNTKKSLEFRNHLFSLCTVSGFLFIFFFKEGPYCSSCSFSGLSNS